MATGIVIASDRRLCCMARIFAKCFGVMPRPLPRHPVFLLRFFLDTVGGVTV
ncbi:hypothetical protein [Rickettsia endosymbiont of Orchestes rusci]|uniref:hypothetical protein n=1 Tax=Rickettsia endosymbiont of Orchestes rusci TaxID=3066250 RepID=UPI00313B5E60